MNTLFDHSVAIGKLIELNAASMYTLTIAIAGALQVEPKLARDVRGVSVAAEFVISSIRLD